MYGVTKLTDTFSQEFCQSFNGKSESTSTKLGTDSKQITSCSFKN